MLAHRFRPPIAHAVVVILALACSGLFALAAIEPSLAGVPIAAGALYPFFGILLSPEIGAAAMALSSVSVIANALRLRRVGL